MNKIILLFLSTMLFVSQVHARSALDQVNKTNTINCGYVEYSPALIKNMKTNQWGGFDYDVVQAVANRLQLKADFTVPTGWATVVTDLDSGKFDMLCSGFWVHPNVGKFALFSRPVFFQPVFIVARADDNRFVPSMNMDDPAFTMAALDGDNPVYIAKSDFPKVKHLLLSNMTDFSQVLVNVVDGKADFTIVDAYTFGLYDKHNPGKLKIVAPESPVRVYPVSYVFGKDDAMFRDAVNAALDELILDGTIDQILDQYDEYPNAYYRATIHYKNKYMVQ